MSSASASYDYPLAIIELNNLVSAKYYPAAYELALSYYIGRGVEENYIRAGNQLKKIPLVNRPSPIGLPLSKKLLEKSTEKSHKKAFCYLFFTVNALYNKLYDSSYKEIFLEACVLSGYCYLNGWGVDQNLVEARRFFKIASGEKSREALLVLQALQLFYRLDKIIFHCGVFFGSQCRITRFF